ncbi:MAG: peptidoglycan DD-metalloendopeptidase family protein [Hyphomicrobiales bacterium]|nr:peptidoglycan DD-metalloendopeptidase family protein [Hyphomicrobiales bacterium]
MATGSIRHTRPMHHPAIYHPPVQYAQPITSEPLAAPKIARYVAPVSSAPSAGFVGASGVAIVAGTGDSASVLARRYNVPEAALLRANGFHSAADIQPGTHLIIPYQTQKAARAAPFAAAPVMAAARTRVPRLPLASRQPGSFTYSHPDLAPRSLQQQARGAPHIPVAAAAVGAAAVGGGAFALTRMHDLAEIKKYKAEAAAARAELAEARQAQHAGSRTASPKLAAARAAKVAATQKKLAALQQHEAMLRAKKLAEARQAQSLKATKAQQAKIAKAKLEKAEQTEKAEAMARSKAHATQKVAIARQAQAPAAVSPKVDTKPTGSIAMGWPVHGRIIRGFEPGVNDGINISVPDGTPVRAIDGGVVAYAGSQLKGYGNLVLIRHPNGFISAYADNGALNVKRGQTVTRGEVIAHSGQSGDVSSPQLHFELRKGTVPVNPTHFLAGT